MPPTPREPNRAIPVVHWLTLLAANAIPAVGWFTAEWSAATTLIVYWFETAAGVLFIYLRGLLQQRWHPRRGHFRYEAPKSKGAQGKASSFINGFLFVNLIFTAAHGFFIAVILGLLTHNGRAEQIELDWRSAGVGCLQILAVLVVDFLVDVPYLRSWSFAQLEQTADRSFGRIAVVHLALIFGMFAAAITDSPTRLFGVFVVLKTMYSLSTALPQWQPKAPPVWLSRSMNRLRSEPAGQRFEDVWVKDIADDERRHRRNEEQWTE